MRLENLDRAVGRVMFGGGGEFSPTLVIGMGGSGSSTARRVKRILDDRYGDLHIIKFLIVDTDTGGYSEEGGMAAVEEDERASIVAPNASEIHRQMRDGLKPEIAKFLPDSADVSLLDDGTGAGAIRPVGRFALFSQMTKFYSDRLKPTCYSLNHIETVVREKLQHAGGNIQINSKSPRIYITCSVCGGTGSSLFVDTAALIRHAFGQIGVTPTIIGVFFLPSVFMQESGITSMVRANIQANGYAALMELEHFCRSDIQQENWSFDYPEIGTVEIDRSLYDECYLIEGINSKGQLLGNKNEVFEMTARGICMDIGSPVGAKASSAKRNIFAHLPNNPCIETGKERKMNSFAITGLRVPVDRIARYCCLRAASEVIHDHLLKQPSERDLMQEINQFLSAHQLDERGSRDQILDSLLKTRDGHPLTFVTDRTQNQLYEQARTEGNKGKEAQYAQDWLAFKRREAENRLSQEAASLARMNQESVLKSALEAIYSKTSELLDQHGVRHCQEFLSGLLTVFEKVAEELQQESEDAGTTIQTLKESMQSSYDDLKEFTGTIGGFKARFSKSDEQVVETALGELEGYGNALIKQQARQAAIEVLNNQNRIRGTITIIPALKELINNLFNGWVGLLEESNQRIRRELAHHQLSQGTGTTYVLDQILDERGDFDGIYERIQLDLQKITKAYLVAKPDSPDNRDQVVEKVGPFTVRITTPEKVVDELASQAVEPVMSYLKQEMSVGRILQRLAGREDRAAAYTTQQLQSMLDKCQPFWSTSVPQGRQNYDQFFAVSVPCLPDDPEQETIRQTVKKAVVDKGHKSELVENGYPFALEICNFAYGARAYYLKSAEEMRLFYEEKSSDAAIRARLHIDKRFIGRIPKLHPEEHGEALGLFAWGVAYGYIAKDGNFYYLGINESENAVTPKYQTDWSPSIFDLMDSSWQGAPQKKRDKADQLAQGRENAIEALQQHPTGVKQLLAARNRYEDHWGQARAQSEIEEYLRRLDELIRDTNNEETRELLKAEAEELN
ncbi:MAG: hypothetical protein KIT45_13245 [Fimbriimonadia bacterium]|nr:hypothetical protein [Fimbriimonadia bacterium]